MIKLAIAPIGWTNDNLPELGGDIPFEQCISEMALAGFQGCEVGSKYPKNDLELLKRVGLSVTPFDASDDAIKISDYKSKYNSGNGAFRELADLILLIQNNKQKNYS